MDGGNPFESQSKYSRSMHGIMALRRNSAVRNKSFVFANFETGCGSEKIQNFTSNFWSVFFSSWALHNGTYYVGLDESRVSANDNVVCAFWIVEEDDKILVRPASRKEPAKEREWLTYWWRRSLTFGSSKTATSCTSAKKERNPQYSKTQLLHWNMRHPKTRASEQKTPQVWAQKQKVKLHATS